MTVLSELRLASKFKMGREGRVFKLSSHSHGHLLRGFNGYPFTALRP